MKAKRRTEIKIETHEITLIRFGNKVANGSCQIDGADGRIDASDRPRAVLGNLLDEEDAEGQASQERDN